MNLADLKAPLPPASVSWRVGSTTGDKKKGMALAYIDARDVMERLDAVCGPEGWQRRYTHAEGKTICEIGIKIGDEWIWKADGAGDSDIEAEKGAISDAFKRAAVNWGIGRYLYDLESPWVELDTKEANGKTFVKGIAKHEFKRLETLLAGNAPVQTALPKELEPHAPTRDAITLADTLIAAANIAATLADLEAWGSSAEIQAQIKELPTSESSRVRAAYKVRKDRLLQKEVA